MGDIRRFDASSLLEFNIQRHLEREFIDMGLYSNAASGQMRTGGQRIDVLTRQKPRIYNSFFNNWIEETDSVGITGALPINVSGVVINGAFHARNTSPFFPAIDFENGRVIFGADIAIAATVEAIFSYKHVHVDFPRTELIPLLFSELKDNVTGTNTSIPSGLLVQLPIVVIDLQDRVSSPRQLGGGTVQSQQVVFHILANNRRDMNRLVDQLSTRSDREVIQGVDFNKVSPLLTIDGDRASTYKNFTELQADSSVAWEKLYIDSTSVVTNNDVLYDFHRARVDWDMIFHRPPGG